MDILAFLRRTVVVAIILFGLASESVAKPEPELLKQNVSDYLHRLGLSDKLLITGVSQKGDEIYAEATSGSDIIEVLENNPREWSHDMFGKFLFLGHQNCRRSWRYTRRNPSLQITQLQTADGSLKFEIDIDLWAPRWTKPIDLMRHVGLEIIPHAVMTRIFRRKEFTTGQPRITRLMKKWKD